MGLEEGLVQLFYAYTPNGMKVLQMPCEVGLTDAVHCMFSQGLALGP